MLKKELSKKLKSEYFNSTGYSLEGSTLIEGHCMDHRDGYWYTYYFERGMEFELEQFRTEEEACNRLYEKIKNDPFMKKVKNKKK